MAAHLNACGVDSLIHSIPHSTDKLTTPWRKKNIEKGNERGSRGDARSSGKHSNVSK